jgi:tetratricopeptide (TPR) repeat protein
MMTVENGKLETGKRATRKKVWRGSIFYVALASFSIFNFQFSIAQHRDTLPVIHYVDGVRLAAEERFEEAIASFGKALESDPDHAPTLFSLAGALAAAGRTAEALGHSSRAVELDPANSWYRDQQGRLLVSLEKYDEALALLEETVAGPSAFDPDDYRMLAILYYRKGRTDDALAVLDSARVRIGPAPEIVEMKRGLLIEAGRIDEAVALTEAYIATAPYDEENRLALAEIYAYQRKDSLHGAMLRQVVEINPDNETALTALVDFYRARGQTSLSLAALRQLFTVPDVPLDRKIERFEVLAQNTNLYRSHFFEIGALALTLVTEYPGEARVVELYADHAVRGGDAEGALQTIKSRLERPGPTLGLYLKAIEIEAYLQRPDSVAVWSERALRSYPDEIQIYLLRASALQYMKRPREARKTLSAALRVATTDSLRSEIHGATGTLWHEEGNDKKTFAAYEKALACNADNALVLNNYAYFLTIAGRQLDRALGMAQRAVKLKPGMASYLDTWAWVLFKTGDAAEARRVMQQALPLDMEQSAELMIHYGDILWALDERFMATIYWKKARDAGWEPVEEIEERLSRVEQ